MNNPTQPIQGRAGASPKPILVAVDATNLVHRSHHAFAGSDRRSLSGRPVWALWGLARMLSTATAKVADTFRRPAGLVLCFDGPHESCHRRAMDATYKAIPREPNPDLEFQLHAAPRWLADCGFYVATFDGYEADDGCASAAHAATAAGWRCVIVTSDRDALAHASASTRVLRPANGGGWDMYGTPEITAKYNTPPVHGAYATFSALRGDPSDELPGVAGIGEKTAATMLCSLHAAGRTVDDVLAGDETAIEAITPRAFKLLTEGSANYLRNRKLMDAVVDLPVDLAEATAPCDPAHIIESCAYQGVSDAEEFLLKSAPTLSELVGSDF
jgi:DNA polymerase-1